MSSLFVYNLPIRFDEAALRLVFDGEVVNSITWGGCPPPIGRFAIVSGPDTVDYVAGKKPYIAEGHTLGFAFSPVDCASMNVVQASDYRPAEDDAAPGARGGRGGRGAGRGRGDGRGRGRGDGRGRGGDAGRGRGEGKRERENTAVSPVGEERQLGRKQEEIAFGAATASKKVTFEDDEAAAATADANAVGAAAAEEATPAPAPAQVKRAPGTGDSCKFCGSNDHLSRRCPNKAGGAPAPAPPVAVAPAAPAVSAAPEPVELVVVKKSPEAPRAVARPPPVEEAPPAPKPQRVQGTSKDSCKFCGSDAHLSRQCPNKNKK